MGAGRSNFMSEKTSMRFIERQIDKITYLIEVKESKTAQETVYQKLKRRIENDAKQSSHQALHCVHHSENKSTSSS
jgi:2-oxo-4-hydroxy-4-carboxy--5-ureidoimidazoline (OHCU) decarboxylase